MEAAKQTRTATELSKAFQVHPVQISQWKKHLLDNIETLFRDGRRREREEGQARQAELFEQIGRLNMEPSSNRNGNRFAVLSQVFRGQ
jgi:hypothetical protein